MENKKNNVCVCKSTVSPSVSCRGTESLADTLKKVYEQIEIDCYKKSDEKLVKEIALNMAVIYRLPDRANVKIGGMLISAAEVKEIYQMITGKQIDDIIAKIKAAGEIRYPVAYIRTSLYNSMLETEIKSENLYGGI